ncbi:MAG TPA: DUF1203 domain-containing protein [Gemmatimonadales bacterium]
MSYRVHAIPQDVADEVRATMRSPGYGHPAHRELAKGTGPCRSCLRPFRVGQDERILFTYQPFDGLGLPSPGPIFIHAEPCQRYQGHQIPRELLSIPLILEAFTEDGLSLGRLALGKRDPDDAMAELLFDTGAEYIHLRHAEAGCFIARVEPVRIHEFV